MVIIAGVAIVSAVSNWRMHQTYAFASRVALFAAALHVLFNPGGVERLIRSHPGLAWTIGLATGFFVVAYYVLFHVIPMLRQP